jgi:hypothetical protein
MKEISEIFEDIKSKVNLSENDFDILSLKNFELNFSENFENKEVIVNRIKSEIGNASGFYAIYNEDCLYIGIGRPIWKRIKSHYYSSNGKDKAVKWVEFFKEHRDNLKIYWKEFSVSENKKIDDKVRLLIEAILTEKYDPKFERK